MVRPITQLGIIGCGNISETYLTNASLFKALNVHACTDIDADVARDMAERFGIKAMSANELLGDQAIDIVLNLTVPSEHFKVSTAVLAAGKHLYTEKPLATCVSEGQSLLELANARQLLVGSAPDTFLGAAGRLARRLIDGDDIGTPVTGTAFMLGRGMEHWHPDPRFYYQPGAGPLLDMGPYYLTTLVSLLGPVRQVAGMAHSGQSHRLITADGPLNKTHFPVEIPTTQLAILQFHSGAIVSIGTSWDVHRHSNHPLEIHGVAGSLRLPDPDTFGGVVSCSAAGEPWVDHVTHSAPFGLNNWPYDTPDRANYRMLAVADMAGAIQENRQPRASGTLALHVLAIMESIATASAGGQTVTVETRADRPEPLSEADALAFTQNP